MTTPDADPSATLEEIKARAFSAQCAPSITRDWARGKSADDVPRLVAALEAVLKLTDSATVLLSACGVSGRCSCGEHPVAWDLDPAKIRAAITNELNGERGGHARTA